MKTSRYFWFALGLALASPTWAGGSDPALLITPDAPRFSLDEIGLYRVGYQYRGQAEREFAPGWSGGFEAQTGVALEPAGELAGRAAVLLHPPWRGGTGVAFQDFQIRLPAVGEVQRITLIGATAMRQDAIAGPGEKTKSDGATFRIFVNERKLLDEHRADTQWKPFSLDLTHLAGQIVTVRFETDPGPGDDPSFDFALWGGRELVLQGFQPKHPAIHATVPPLDMTKLYPVQNGETAPPSGFAGAQSASVDGNIATLVYRGTDGTMRYQWTPPSTGDDSPLGRWRLVATPADGGSAVTVPLAGQARLEWNSKAVFKQSRMETVTGGAACVSAYDVNGQPATVRYVAKLSGKSLVIEITCDVPQVEAFEAGSWGPVLHRRAVPVPYYSGQVFYLEAEDLFAGVFLDWMNSAASTHENTRANYGARTDGSRNLLHERAVFTAAWHLAETLPNIPNPPSPFRGHLGDKIILDTWGGQFEDIATNLKRLHDYGVQGAAVIIHDWQRSGYDNALPAHVPANEKLGGEPAMKQLVATARQLGYDIALHENYVDYYPNYEGFNLSDVAVDSQSNRVNAWFNPGTKIQSFAVQPHAILPLAHRESAQILGRYHPNADYLDVHSAVPPWFHVDYRAGAEGAGGYLPVWEAHRQLWAFERATYGGPVLGEGCNHWFWSGLLDGVEAQFGDGWRAEAGRSAPLLVDFDLLKIHPLQFNHGMGYYERWWGTATWGWLPPMEVLDQYRMQEIIFGHAGFLGGSTYANVPMAWLEHHLVSPVTARYATARPVKIEYQVNDQWVDGSAAAKAGVWNRVRVTYNNGLVVAANQSTDTFREGGRDLPPYGWSAQGAGVMAWTALCQGVIADFAGTADSIFANARPAADWNQSGIHRIRPTVSGFHPAGDRAFVLEYQWQVGETLPRNYGCFVHFVRGDDILFQDDHGLPRATSTWKAGDVIVDGPHTVHLPASLPDGDYGVRIGMYLPNAPRLALQGKNDGQDRIQLGTLHVREQGKAITFDPSAQAAGGEDDLYPHRLNLEGKVLDFGEVRTDGSVLVRREGSGWVLRPLPRTRSFTVELSAARFGKPSAVRCVGGTTASVAPEDHGGWWQIKLNGATEYRW